MESIHLRVPASRSPTLSEKILDRAVGLVASPLAWLVARFMRLPGLNLHPDAAHFGLSLLGTDLPRAWLYQLVLAPIALTRYFEFAFACESLAKAKLERYLDVSSPRLLPLLLLDRHPACSADLLNPDPRDLAITARVVAAKRWQGRVQCHECRVADAPFAREQFDVITSLSVLEHIPDDTAAVQKLWAWLKPGGRMVLTMPCAARPAQVFVNRDEYGLLAPDAQGDYFLEYQYDEARLRERVLSVTGEPVRRQIFGERHPHFLRERLIKGWAQPDRYDWSEVIQMGREFQPFAGLADLPGEGVVCLEFVKP